MGVEIAGGRQVEDHRQEGAAEALNGVVNGILERLEGLWEKEFSSCRDNEPDDEANGEGEEGEAGQVEKQTSKLVDELFSRAPVPAVAVAGEAVADEGAAMGAPSADEFTSGRPRVVSHF